MPLYKLRSTGAVVSRSEDYVSAFPVGTFTLVKEESVSEKRERERLEALEHKVDTEDPIEKEGKH